VNYRVHPTAEVSERASIGEGASVWHQAQVREGATIGAGCIIGKGVYIGADVSLGTNCKVQNYSCVYEGNTLEDGVFVGPEVVFTNDRYPRAINPDGSLKAASDWELQGTLVKYGAAIGSRSVILPGLVIGRWALVAAGSVVTKSVLDHAIVAGNPAKQRGWACVCARPLSDDLVCPECRKRYALADGALSEAT
jgi:UDP-2-acetamido-3-amino-2,3-dideoxy-glucuronate N-acetyltransferase